MIVESSGSSVSESLVISKTSKIVSATGTAYVRKGKIKSIIRFVRKTIVRIKNVFTIVKNVFLVKKQNTKSGIPSSMAPPLKVFP